MSDSSSKSLSFQEIILAVFTRIGRFVRRQLSWVAFAIALFGVLALLWSWTESWRVRKVVIYTAPNGGDPKAFGRQIKTHFEEKENWWLLRYDVDVRTSEGLHDNRQKVTEARPGDLVLGFDQDGFAENGFGNVRSLLPLTEIYLHVVANADVARKAAAKDGFTLASLLAYKQSLADGAAGEPKRPRARCYLGPRGSGSRQIAEVVLKRALVPFKLTLADVDVDEHLSWDTAYTLLARGEIDAVFDGSDLGSGFITGKAGTEKYTLLGLDDVDGLVGSNRQAGFRARTIPKGSYAAGSGFCPGPVQTVATQRMIICPDSMSDFDAYYLARGCQKALANRIPEGWDGTDTSAPGARLICLPHPGAEDYRRGGQPGIVRLASNNWQWFLSIVGGFLFFAFRQKGLKWLVGGDGPVPVPTITPVPQLRLRKDQASRRIPFAILDGTTSAEKLEVSAESSDPAVVPADRGIDLQGTDGQRTVRIIPAPGAIGSAIVTLTVENEAGGKAQTKFEVKVQDGGPPPGPRTDFTAATLARSVVAADREPTPKDTAGPPREKVPLPVLEKLFDAWHKIEWDYQHFAENPSRDQAKKLFDRTVACLRKVEQRREELGPAYADYLDLIEPKLRDLKAELGVRIDAPTGTRPV